MDSTLTGGEVDVDRYFTGKDNSEVRYHATFSRREEDANTPLFSLFFNDSS